MFLYSCSESVVFIVIVVGDERGPILRKDSFSVSQESRGRGELRVLFHGVRRGLKSSNRHRRDWRDATTLAGILAQDLKEVTLVQRIELRYFHCFDSFGQFDHLC